MVTPGFKPDFYMFSYNEQLRKIQRSFINKFLLYHTSLILKSWFMQWILPLCNGLCNDMSLQCLYTKLKTGPIKVAFTLQVVMK